MHGIPLGAWLAIGGLIMLPDTPGAQEQSAQDLIGRIRQIQAEQQAAPQPSEQPAPAAMQPDLSEDEMRAMVRESLDVEILRVEVVEHDGRPAYAITVMSPPGNRNDAYRVATLLFDGATGSLLGQRSPAPRSAAADPSTAPAAGGFEGAGPEIRRRTWR
jgi:hypothetical protein